MTVKEFMDYMRSKLHELKEEEDRENFENLPIILNVWDHYCLEYQPFFIKRIDEKSTKNQLNIILKREE